MFEKQRKHPRFPLFGVAEVREKGHEERYVLTALIQSISEAGAGLYTHQAVAVGTPVSLTIKFTDRTGKSASDDVEGTVASLTNQKGFYYIGVAFNGLINREKQPNLYLHFHEVLKIGR